MKKCENKNKEKLWECIETLYWVLYQACGKTETNEGDSFALTAYGEGLRLLSKYGLFDIKEEFARRVIGYFRPLPKNLPHYEKLDRR